MSWAFYGMQRCASNHPVRLYRKGLGACDALLCVAHNLQSALEIGQEARIVQIEFSIAFDRVKYQGDSLQVLFGGSWRFSAVCSDTVSL